MKEIDPRIDENKLWEKAFPYFYRQSVREGIYIIPRENEFIAHLEQYGDGDTPAERAISRLDMAILCLWPHLQELFVVDFFPHRLAAATDLLRAAEFGESGDQRVNLIAGQLAQALDDVERLLAGEAERESYLKAAEDE